MGSPVPVRVAQARDAGVRLMFEPVPVRGVGVVAGLRVGAPLLPELELELLPELPVEPVEPISFSKSLISLMILMISLMVAAVVNAVGAGAGSGSGSSPLPNKSSRPSVPKRSSRFKPDVPLPLPVLRGGVADVPDRDARACLMKFKTSGGMLLLELDVPLPTPAVGRLGLPDKLGGAGNSPALGNVPVDDLGT